jgi:hypothetical protein
MRKIKAAPEWLTVVGVPGIAGMIYDTNFTGDFIVTRASGASGPCLV